MSKARLFFLVFSLAAAGACDTLGDEEEAGGGSEGASDSGDGDSGEDGSGEDGSGDGGGSVDESGDDGGPTGCVDDEAEDDDDAELGTPVDLSAPSSFEGRVSCPDDDDWFVFITEEPYELSVDVTYTAAEGELIVSLWSMGGMTLGTADGSGGALSLQTSLEPGVYGVLVQLAADVGTTGGTDYTMSIVAE